jgi:parallel beta-helix repeat protein
MGKKPPRDRKYRWLMWLCPILGLGSLIWFLVRVIPKPSRATYPCQRVAAPFASAFVIWLMGLFASILAYRKAKRSLYQSRWVVAGVCIAVGVLALWLSLSFTGEAPATADFTPTDPPNSPMGVAKGIHAGRVVWIHDPAATRWDGSTGSWWDEDNTDQGIVDGMVSRVIQTLAGEPNDATAWDVLFRHFNQTQGRSDVGYQRGEKIAIKINMNQENSSGGNWSSRVGNPSPQVVYSMVRQLVEVVGVSGSAITIYDASRYIGNPIYDKIRNDVNPQFRDIRFVVKSTLARNGRIGAADDRNHPLHTRAGTAYLPQCVTEAKYLINMALLRPHSLYGITLCAKNHFGSVRFPSVSGNGGWTPEPLHNHGGRSRNMDTYNCLVNLNGHRHLGGKTLLYFIDGLYSARNQSNEVIKWESFGDDWCSSLFVSQDPVAIDSVALDFLRNEPRCTDVTGYPENYLHEMAWADNPPSGTFYDPENDGVRLGSLGVHEHWNNPVDKQYTRNLGLGDGIELVIASYATADGPVENISTGKRYDRIQHAINEAVSGDEIVIGEGTYFENINFSGKNLTLRSTDPDDPVVVAATIINGSERAVTFSRGEDDRCALSGLTITAGQTGIYCFESSPTITHCRIVNSGGPGIELRDGSNPAITSCEITSNIGAGIEIWMKKDGRIVIYNYPALTHCIITENGQNGISGGIPTITNCTIAANDGCGVSNLQSTVTNSIIYFNGDNSAAMQVEGEAFVTYTAVQGGRPGEGNIDADPCFALVGYWDLNGTPEDTSDDFRIPGDYHLRSQTGRWDANEQAWVRDAVTSPCIDAGNADSDWIAEPEPNGQRINMGAYGGTPQASMSHSESQ